MKLEDRGKQTQSVEDDVNEFIEEIIDLEDVTGFICCVLTGDGKNKTLIAANQKQMMALSLELMNVATALDEYDEDHKGKTLQ